LLLDEPLSNLDAALRVSIRKQIRKIQQELSITTVFVTHDQEEAMSISDRVAVMKTAKLVQVGNPVDIYRDPKTAFVANFIGKTTMLHGAIQQVNAESCTIDVNGFSLVARKRKELAVGTKVWVSIRPQDVQYASELKENQIKGTVDYLESLGSLARGEIVCQGIGNLMFEVANPLYNPVPTLNQNVSVSVARDAVIYGEMADDDNEVFANEQDNLA